MPAREGCRGVEWDGSSGWETPKEQGRAGHCRRAARTVFWWVWAIGLILAGSPCRSAYGVIDVAEIVRQVNVDSYRNYLQKDLYAHNGDDRSCQGAQHDPAMERIRERFESLGLVTGLGLPFAVCGRLNYNVVGVHPGVICPKEIYVLGAHYDTAAGSPGAWDNASGVAGVLEAARVLSRYAFEATIVFVAFDREEQGRKGSQAYVEEHRLDHIRAMIALDGIAYRPYRPNDPDYLTVGHYYPTRQTELVDSLPEAMQSYAGLTCVVFQDDLTDDAPFDHLGFSTAALISRGLKSDKPPPIHKPSDSVDTPNYLDYDYGTQVTRGAVGFLAAQARLALVQVLPDFDADGFVDLRDFARLAQHWRWNQSPFDISPAPKGKSAVNFADLNGLSYYWRNRWSNWWPDFGLLARWRFEEAQGAVAYDSGARHKDAILHGSPVWRQVGGGIAGALQFDGKDDYASTAFVWDPSNAGPNGYSVFAWVKGGTPGQVILSQAGGANWLVAAAPEGALMTELRQAGSASKPLKSSIRITDGVWHHVGFIRDGANRRLYVDGLEVARDTQTSLAGSTGGLYIGVGANRATGTFWSGWIGDLRLHDRAVLP